MTSEPAEEPTRAEPPYGEIGRMTVEFNRVELNVHVLCWLLIDAENATIGRAVTQRLQAGAVGDLLVRLAGRAGLRAPDRRMSMASSSAPQPPRDVRHDSRSLRQISVYTAAPW